VSSGRRSRLIWPARERWTGDTFWLSAGQRALLFYIRAQIAHGRHELTIDELARAAGIDRSNVSRGLDRLASLALIGRRSSRGCMGRTIVWRPSRRRALAERSKRATWRRHQPRANVATSIPFGGYLSRERWRTAASNGDREAVRRLTPPRTLYGRCAAGHRARLSRWRWRRWPTTDRAELRTFEGLWVGRCRRCGASVQVSDRVTIPSVPATWTRAGELLAATPLRQRRQPEAQRRAVRAVGPLVYDDNDGWRVTPAPASDDQEQAGETGDK
jgi:DNA-binding MarR family transcriptional regulator